MKTSLLILGSRNYKKDTIKSLIGEAKKLFDIVLFVPIQKIKVVQEDGKIGLYYKGKDLLKFDACYPRFSATDFVFKEIVLKAIDESQMYSPVNLRAYQIINNKYYTVQELSKEDIRCPTSSIFISPEAAKETIHEFGFPVVIKLLSGFAGKGVMLIENDKQLGSILDTVHLFEDTISAQRFIPGKPFDIRCYVFGEKVIAVKRTSKKGEWRANISRGGTAKLIPANDEMKKIAVKAAKALRMDICAVDLMETKKGYSIIEMNFMPGPFIKFLGNKITKEMMEFIYGKVKAR